MTVTIATTPARFGFNPSLSLSYDSGSGNEPFGLGWKMSLPSITRRVDRGVPRYNDTDIFVLSASEDLAPALVTDSAGGFEEVERDGLQSEAISTTYRGPFRSY
jgi:hypothetical protein